MAKNTKPKLQLDELTKIQHLRLYCLQLANELGCSQQICEHEVQRISDEYVNYILTGKASVHEAGIEFHGKTFDA